MKTFTRLWNKCRHDYLLKWRCSHKEDWSKCNIYAEKRLFDVLSVPNAEILTDNLVHTQCIRNDDPLVLNCEDLTSETLMYKKLNTSTA
jgi:hypothetical protein